MVVMRHVALTMAAPRYLGREILGGVLATGQIGVDIFFCLSGFIIVYIALDPGGAPMMTPIVFLKRRFARIVPFLWLVIAAYALLRVVGRGAFPVWNYVRAATLFPLGPVDPSVVWTLRYEGLFYGVFALTALSRRPRWLLAWVASPLLLALAVAALGPQAGLWADLADYLFSPVNLLFGFGAGLGLAFLRRRATWPAGAWAAPMLLAGLGGVFVTAVALDYQRSQIWHVLVIGLATCATLAVACAVGPARGWLGHLGRRLGDASYCIYLSHVAVVSALVGVVSRHAAALPAPLILTGVFVSAVVAGLALHYVVERPVVAWAQRRMFPRQIGPG